MSSTAEFLFNRRIVLGARDHLGATALAHVSQPLPALVASLILVGAATGVVHETGGTYLPWVHLLYIPILIGAFAYKFVGGVTVAALAGLAVGPWMPLSVENAQAQESAAWIARVLFFMAVGGFAGIVFGALERQRRALAENAMKSQQTGLPNRRQLVVDIQATRIDAVLLVIELSRHDDVADSLGFRHLDQYLSAAAERIQQVLPDPSRLYDLREGRFAALLDSSGSAEDHRAAAHRIPDALDEPLPLDGLPFLSEAQVGVVYVLPGGGEAMDIIRRGGIAVRQAASTGRRVVVYDARDDERHARSHLLLSELQQEMRGGSGLSMRYQPKIGLADGSCRSVEALVRWKHATLGQISPAEFIPLIEGTVLVDEFTRWMFGSVLRELATGLFDDEKLCVSVNVSVRNLESSGFADDVASLVAAHRVPAERIEIEVTESAVMRDPAGFGAALRDLRSAGFRIALDDFGTGQSSFTYLSEMPLDVLKLDRSFTTALHDRRESTVIVESAIRAAHGLGLEVVAEGIEDEATREQLASLGCDLGQGYLWAPAMPATELCDWLSKHRTLH